MKASDWVPRGLTTYLRSSRDTGTSVLLVLPLFVAYQIGVLTTGGVRNGVDFMTDLLHLLVGGSVLGYLGVNALLLAGLLGAAAWLRQKGSFQPRIVPWMLAESLVYSLCFGGAVVTLADWLGLDALLSVGGSLGNRLVLSIGAGLYEELVFRVLLFGGLYALGTRVLGQSVWLSGAAALLVSSAIFSGVHHLGSLGEAFTVSAFVYRFLAGVLLALLYRVRGLAIAVYTHALYDIWVLVVLGG